MRRRSVRQSFHNQFNFLTHFTLLFLFWTIVSQQIWGIINRLPFSLLPWRCKPVVNQSSVSKNDRNVLNFLTESNVVDKEKKKLGTATPQALVPLKKFKGCRAALFFHTNSQRSGYVRQRLTNKRLHTRWTCLEFTYMGTTIAWGCGLFFCVVFFFLHPCSSSTFFSASSRPLWAWKRAEDYTPSHAQWRIAMRKCAARKGFVSADQWASRLLSQQLSLYLAERGKWATHDTSFAHLRGRNDPQGTKIGGPDNEIALFADRLITGALRGNAGSGRLI